MLTCFVNPFINPKTINAMKKLSFLFALLCVSMMAFAVAEDTWLEGNATYANQFKWFAIDGVTAPMEVINIQAKDGVDVIFVNVGQADFDRTTGIIGCEAITDDGAGVWIKISSLTKKNNEIYFKNAGGTTLRGLIIYNDKGAEDLASEYCGEIFQAGTNTEAAFTWETNAEGSVVITISETLGGADDATYFRANGINADKFTIGEDHDPITTYFTHPGNIAGQSTLTLTLTDPSNAPAIGTKIYVTNQIIEYATSKDGNAWPTLTFEYTYGSKCLIVPELTKIDLTAASPFAKVGEGVAITAKAKDQMNKTMDVEINFTVTPADAGSLVEGVFTPAKKGTATITATSGLVSASIEIYALTDNTNLALNKDCEGGYYDNNPAEGFGKANDGDVSTAWVTYADQDVSKEWWYVDLGAKYTIEGIDVVWGEPSSTQYILQVRDDAPGDEDKADDDAWETISTQTGVSVNSEQFVSFGTVAGRYVRVHSLARSANFLRLKEVRVFGSEWVDVDDTEKPVMVSAALDSKTWNSATIAVSATDNVAVAKYHVVDATNSIDTKCVPAEGKITITGLTASTAYNFTITALDAANNESENSESVEVTTYNHLLAPTAAATVPTWPVSQVKAIYSPTYEANCNFQEWGSGTIYTQEEFGKKFTINGYFGMDGFELNCLLMEKLHVDIWVDDNASLRLVPIYGGEGLTTDDTHGKLVNLVGQQWNSIDLTLADDFAGLNLSSIFQFKIDNATGITFWIGNLYFYRETEIEDNEKPTNVTASKVSESFFSVVLAVSAEDNSGVVNFDILNGEEVIANGGGASGATVNITVNGLKPNTDYSFSVIAKDEKGNAADAVNVTAKTLVAPAAAPAPDFTGKAAVPVFCDALENNPAITIGNWGQTTKVQVVELAEGDHVYYCTNFNYLGWELTPAVDASDMEYVHVDLFAPEMTSVRITPISPGKEKPIAKALTFGQWTSLDIELSEYNVDIVWENIFQFKFDEAVGGNELFIDNVYFFKNADATAVDNTEVSAKTIKVLENGQLIIIKNGVRYNVQGAKIK